MSIFRVERTRDYTVMSNHHPKNKVLSLKAKGLMSLILSLPDNWDYTLQGLAHISLEKIDAVRRAVKELECQGYIISEIEMLLNPDDSEGNSTSSEPQTKLRADEKVGQNYGLSRDKVAKYIRISNLIQPLMSQVDTGDVPFLAAYDLSFIGNIEKQQRIADFMEADNYKVDMKKAELLREYYDKSTLSDNTIVQILSGEKTRKPKSDKPKPVKIKPAVITKYFTTGQSSKEIEETIEKALELYFENQDKEVELIE